MMMPIMAVPANAFTKRSAASPALAVNCQFAVPTLRLSELIESQLPVTTAFQFKVPGVVT